MKLIWCICDHCKCEELLCCYECDTRDPRCEHPQPIWYCDDCHKEIPAL